MFKFTDYIYEIWTIAKNEKVPYGVAYDKFRADIAEGKAVRYNTGDNLPGFDFAAIKAVWDSESITSRSDAYSQWHEVMAVTGIVKALHDAYPDREKMDEVVRDAERKVAERKARRAKEEQAQSHRGRRTHHVNAASS